MGNVPEQGPVLLVGNHSGGNVTPDTSSSRSPSRPTSASSGPSTSSPTTSSSPRRSGRSCAATAPSPPRTSTPSEALEAGAALLVYPGGDWEVHRPVLGGQQGRLRRPQGVHPARAGRGRADRPGGLDRRPGDGARSSAAATWLAKLHRLDKMFRLKVLPISLALPWGLNIGDFLGHIPLPAKITIEVLPPIDLQRAVRPRPRPRRGLRARHARDAGDARRRSPPSGASR